MILFIQPRPDNQEDEELFGRPAIIGDNADNQELS